MADATSAVSPLRRRMIDDMTLRNLPPATQRSYLHAITKFSRYFDRSPDRLGLEDVRAFQVYRERHERVILPGGGPSLDGTRWIACRPGFFLPVRVLSRLYRQLFLEGLRVAFEVGQLQFFGDLADLADPPAFTRLQTATGRRNWVVHAKPPFGGPEQVLAYLSRYTHRVAIANSRLIGCEDGKVTFRWRDYRHGRRPRRRTLDVGEFIRRFLLHTLPDGVHRIRHYGFLANGQRAARLAACRALLATQAPEAAIRPAPAVKAARAVSYPCPCCGHPMVTLAVWHHGQAPPRGPFWNDSS